MEIVLNSSPEEEAVGEGANLPTAHHGGPGTYFAVLYVPGRVERAPREKGKGKGKRKPQNRFCLRLEETCFPLPKHHRGKPMEGYLGSTCGVRLWPRTLADGTLDPASPVAAFLPKPKVTEVALFALRGRLVAVDRDGGTFGVEIRQNPQGRLAEPFRLTLWASLSLLEDLPPLGQGVYVEGQYRPKSRRLVALKALPHPLWDDPTPT